jgi:hypothetical protein
VVEPVESTVDDFTVIPGVGKASAKAITLRGITTLEQLRADALKGRFPFLPGRVADAIAEWAKTS